MLFYTTCYKHISERKRRQTNVWPYNMTNITVQKFKRLSQKTFELTPNFTKKGCLPYTFFKTLQIPALLAPWVNMRLYRLWQDSWKLWSVDEILAIRRVSAPIQELKILDGIFELLSGILTILKGKASRLSKSLVLNLLLSISIGFWLGLKYCASIFYENS